MGGEYRLGDVCKFAHSPSREWYAKCFRHQLKAYPRSIAAKVVAAYLSRGPLSKADTYDVVSSQVADYDATVSPSADELVVHMRLGDVIEDSEHSVDVHLASRRKGYKLAVRPLSYYESVLSELRERAIEVRRVVLVSGDHKTGSGKPPRPKTADYIRKVVAWWQDKGFETEVKFNGEPDTDFVYMCRAEIFAPDTGGFTSAICGVRDRLGKPRQLDGNQ